jgi:hypothetical protein
MLEQRALLLPLRRSGSRQVIVDAHTRALLGFVSWPRLHDGPWWRRLFDWQLAVHEHDDEPLLFTVRRRWWLTPRYEVRDADDHAVGLVLGQRLLDRFGFPLAQIAPCSRQQSVIRSLDQRDFAALDWLPEGLRLTFADAVVAAPFNKMLILAAALAEMG